MMESVEAEISLQDLQDKAAELSKQYDRWTAGLRKLQRRHEKRVRTLLKKLRGTRSRRLTLEKMRGVVEDSNARGKAGKQTRTMDEFIGGFQQLYDVLLELDRLELGRLQAQPSAQVGPVDERSWQLELKRKELRRSRKLLYLCRRQRHYLSDELHLEEVQLDLLQELSAKVSRARRRYLQPRVARLSKQSEQMQAELEAVVGSDGEDLVTSELKVKSKSLSAFARKRRAEVTRLENDKQRRARALENLRAKYAREMQQLMLEGRADSHSAKRLRKTIRTKAQALERVEHDLGNTLGISLQAARMRIEQAKHHLGDLNAFMPELEKNIAGVRTTLDSYRGKQEELGQEVTRLTEHVHDIENLLEQEGLSVHRRRPRHWLSHRQRGFFKGLAYFFFAVLGVVVIGSLVAAGLGIPKKEIIGWAWVAVVMLVIVAGVLGLNFGKSR